MQAIDRTLTGHATSLDTIQRTMQQQGAMLASIATRFERIQTISPPDYDLLQATVAKLKLQTRLDHGHYSPSSSSAIKPKCLQEPPPVPPVSVADNAKEGIIATSLDRLMVLSNEKNLDIQSTEAEPILDDLKAILKFITNNQYSHEHQVQDLNRLRKPLPTVRQVSVNGKFKAVSLDLPYKYEREFTYGGTRTSLGDFAVSIGKARRRFVSSENNDQPIEVLYGSLRFIPSAGRETIMTVEFQQYIYQKQFISTSPSLIFSRMLPNTAEIFRVVSKGDLVGLLRLLRKHEASLNDRDQDGRSLLHVSTGICARP
jgi:hypothetical protein